MRALCWIRRDLRLQDHRALARATELADEVAVVFVFDTTILDALEDRDDRRVTFIHQSLVELNDKLGGRLVVLHGDPVDEIPKLGQEWGAELVVTARDFEVAAIERDRRVAEKVRLELVTDHVVLPGEEVLNQSGLPFRVFTPYSRAWRARVRPEDLAEATPNLEKLTKIPPACHPWALEDIGFRAPHPLPPHYFGAWRGGSESLWLEPGETAALLKLRSFQQESYEEKRDFPAQAGTSELSAHLRFGTLSPRAAFRAATSAKWESELIWREFYSMLLCHFPETEHEPFQSQYKGMTWPGDPAHFEPWAYGQTGYPLVDAAMRCLNDTGWMHNRLRMVVASFLTKDLLLDWKLGERWFARQLLDFDLASNIGGWQWSSSIGCDPQPYFRVFNPYSQSRKFDPEGEFIRRWVPELADLDSDDIHEPPAMFRGGYPAPMVDHGLMREKAILFLGSFKK